MSSLREWLSSADCIPLLRQCASRIAKRAERLSIPGEALPALSLEELINEIWAFLAEMRGSYAEELMEALLSNNLSGFYNRAVNAFLNHLLDKVRSKSAWHAYYRHARQVLSKSTVKYKAEKKGAFFTFSLGSDLEHFHLTWDELGQYDLPASPLPGANNKEFITSVAEFFYNEVKKKTGCEFWIPLSALVNYIFLKLSDPSIIRALFVSKSDDLSEDGELLPGGEDLLVSVTRKRIESLAEEFIRGLDSKSRKLLYMLMWPGLSPEDLDKELFEAFMTKVIEFCKTEVESR